MVSSKVLPAPRAAQCPESLTWGWGSPVPPPFSFARFRVRRPGWEKQLWGSVGPKAEGSSPGVALPREQQARPLVATALAGPHLVDHPSPEASRGPLHPRAAAPPPTQASVGRGGRRVGGVGRSRRPPRLVSAMRKFSAAAGFLSPAELLKQEVRQGAGGSSGAAERGQTDGGSSSQCRGLGDPQWRVGPAVAAGPAPGGPCPPWSPAGTTATSPAPRPRSCCPGRARTGASSCAPASPSPGPTRCVCCKCAAPALAGEGRPAGASRPRGDKLSSWHGMRVPVLPVAQICWWVQPRPTVGPAGPWSSGFLPQELPRTTGDLVTLARYPGAVVPGAGPGVSRFWEAGGSSGIRSGCMCWKAAWSAQVLV